MTAPARWLPLVSALALLGCDKRAAHDHEEGAHEEADAHGVHAHGAHAHDDALTRVHVKPSMLRDLHLSTRPAEARTAGDVVSALGELHADEEHYAEVGTAIDARVVKVLAAPGDAVRAGHPLVELESVEVGKARAARTGANARLALARATAERKRALVADQIAASREVQAAEAELLEAEAAARAADETLASLGARKGSGARFVLVAPLAGQVLERSVLPGRRVDDARPLFVIADLSTLWLIVHAFERDALRIAPGNMAQVAFAALPGRTFTGKVARIGTRVDAVSRTIDVRIDVDNPSGELRPGMSATAQVATLATRDTIITVPTQAMQRVDARWAVFLPTDEVGAFEVRGVGRGRDLDGEVEVVSGLRVGERVVVDGAFLLKAQVERARGGGDEHHH